MKKFLIAALSMSLASMPVYAANTVAPSEMSDTDLSQEINDSYTDMEVLSDMQNEIYYDADNQMNIESENLESENPENKTEQKVQNTEGISGNMVEEIVDEPTEANKPNPNPGTTVMRGDLTGDKKVSIDDLRLMLRIVCGKVTPTSTHIACGDLERNNKIDVADLRILLRYICGKIDKL